MSNYVKSTDFAAKDALVSGNPLKLIKGTEINDEFNNIQTAIATKADLSSPALSGNPTAPTQAIGNNSTRLANTAFVQQEISNAEAAINITGGTIAGVGLSNATITGGTVSGLTNPLAVADGGTGNATLTANSVLLGNDTSAIQQVSSAIAGNVLRTNGTTWQSQNNLLFSSAQNATSGTSIDFTGLPSWVKRISILLSGISTTSSSSKLIQLGDSGGFENTGYLGSESNSTSSVGSANVNNGFGIRSVSAADIIHGKIYLDNISGNTWVASGILALSNTPYTLYLAGTKSLSDVLTQIRLTTVNGTDTFDAGTINIIYE